MSSITCICFLKYFWTMWKLGLVLKLRSYIQQIQKVVSTEFHLGRKKSKHEQVKKNSGFYFSNSLGWVVRQTGYRMLLRYPIALGSYTTFCVYL